MAPTLRSRRSDANSAEENGNGQNDAAISQNDASPSRSTIVQHASTPAAGVANGDDIGSARRTADGTVFDGRTHAAAAAASLSGDSEQINGEGIGKAKKVPIWSPSTTPPIPPQLAPQVLSIAKTAALLGVLAGLVLPRALQVLDPRTVSHALSAGSWREPASLLRWGGSASAASQSHCLLDALRTAATAPQLHLYLLSWASFHLLEFFITAAYNNTRLYDDSFLLNNGLAYHLAHAFGLIEFITEAIIAPQRKTICTWTYLGLLLMVIGQAARSLAMIHASSNFSHSVAWRKRPDHALVTSGIYALSRHPSYFGFFYWALGTQVLLANPAAAPLFALVLWRFFAARIRGEETHLHEFFGDEYVQYKRRVGTLLPFIR